MVATLPPHNVEAEMSIIGGIILEPETFHSLDLSADDFYVDAHQRIYRALASLAGRGVGLDLVTISEQIQRAGDLDRIGGSQTLLNLIDYTPTAANIGYYADIVRKKSVARRIISAAREMQTEAMTADDPDQLLSDAFGKLQSIGAGGKTEKIWMTTSDMAQEYAEFIRTSDSVRFRTGFPDLDAIIGGVAPGEVMMIVGYSGTFKSAFLQNILINSAVATGKKSCFFSMEMPANLVYQRTVQIGLEQPTYFIESGYGGKKPGYPEQTIQELDRLGISNLITCQKPALTIEQVEHYARLAKASQGNVGVIGIDYLGLMAADGAKSEYERISYCAEQSKNMAKRLKMPVVILTQINRSSAREGEMETWSAKGSGAVEASADYMLGIQREKDKNIIVKVMKNRSGEADLKFTAELDAKFLKFRSLSPYNDIAAKNVDRGKDRKARLIRESAYDNYDPF